MPAAILSQEWQYQCDRRPSRAAFGVRKADRPDVASSSARGKPGLGRARTPPEAARRGRADWRRIGLAAGVALVTLAVFTPTLRNEFVDWDDTDNFVLNEHYRGLDQARLRWMFTSALLGHYQPLSWVTLAGDYLWG